MHYYTYRMVPEDMLRVVIIWSNNYELKNGYFFVVILK